MLTSVASNFALMQAAMSPHKNFPSSLRIAATAVAVAVPGICAIAAGDRVLLIGMIGVLATAVAVIMLLVAVFRYVLDPLEMAARTRSQPTQFTVADFLILVFWLQVPIGLIHALLRKEVGMSIVFDAIAWVICVSAWAISVRILSRAGVTVPRHRALFLAVVLPFAYLGSFALVVSICMLVGAAFSAHFRRDLPFHVIWLIIGAALLACGLQAAAVFVRRMVEATSRP